MSTERDMLNVCVTDAHPETQARWRELKHAVAAELDVDDDELERWEILREATEGYLGLDPRGEWREWGDGR